MSITASHNMNFCPRCFTKWGIEQNGNQFKCCRCGYTWSINDKGRRVEGIENEVEMW